MNGSLPELRGHNPGRTPESAHAPEHLIELLRTLADPIRLRLVRLLEQQVHHGLSVGELADILKLPQSTVSRHLKTLVDAGLAAATREGTSMLYRLADSASGNSTRQLRLIARQHLDHDPLARADAQRLSHILRQRQSESEKFFGKAAAQWDQIRRDWFGDSFHLEAMLALLSPEWTVADLGTGTGAMLPLLAPHVKKVIAIDSSAAMLKGARARVHECGLDNVDLRQGTLEDLPIDKHTLDVALVSLVLHHTIDPTIALREIRRVLKPGGVLIVVDLQPHGVEMFREKMGHRWMGFSDHQLRAWLADAGFDNIRWHPLPAKAARSKEDAVAVPDLFVLRAEATG